MKKLLVASHNQGKVRELRELLAPFGIETVSATEFDLPEPEETESTFAGNARLKSVAAAVASGIPALADDSGLCIPALDGQPGIYSARWGGVEKDFDKAIERIKSEPLKLPPSYQEGLGEVNRRPYNSKNLQNARDLRVHSTKVEKKLWDRIRNKQIASCKFRRQEPLGDYIVDFVCLEKKLIIEIDGGQHQQQQSYDNRRTEYLKSQGFLVIRFWNNEISENIDGVLEVIAKNLGTSPTPPDRRGLVWPSGTPAHFICVLSLAQPDGSSVEFEGRIDGTLTFPARGDLGFGYDPIFVPHHDTRTFAEMTQLEKNQRNHRAAAFAKLVEWLSR